MASPEHSDAELDEGEDVGEGDYCFLLIFLINYPGAGADFGKFFYSFALLGNIVSLK